MFTWYNTIYDIDLCLKINEHLRQGQVGAGGGYGRVGGGEGGEAQYGLS